MLALKLAFASDIFYLLGMLLSKASTILLLQRLSPSRKHAYMCWGATGLSILYAIVTICLISIGCGAGEPYTDLQGKCPGLVRLSSIFSACTANLSDFL